MSKPKPIRWDKYFQKFPRLCPVCGTAKVEIGSEIEDLPIGKVVVSYWKCVNEKKHEEIIL
jgi:C4-type Zn-finger protein